MPDSEIRTPKEEMMKIEKKGEEAEDGRWDLLWKSIQVKRNSVLSKEL